MSKQTIDEIRTKGRWTRLSRRWTDIEVNYPERYATSKLNLARCKAMPGYVVDLHRAATAALGTGGLVQPTDDLWVIRLMGIAGLAAPTLIVAFVAEAPPDVHLTPTPLLRPVWTATDYLGQGWDARSISAIKTHHGVDAVRRDRSPSTYICLAAQ